MIKIIDNFLTKELNSDLQSKLTDKNWHDHIVVENNQIKTTISNWNNIFRRILFPIEESLHYDTKYGAHRFPKSHTARLNCYDRNENSNWYIDNTKDYLVAIYYVNSNNGYTELKDKGLIESKANRLILFSGDIEYRDIEHTDTNFRISLDVKYLNGKEYK